MKRISYFILAFVLLLNLTACSSSNEVQKTNTTEAKVAQTDTPETKIPETVKVKIGITGESENVIWTPVIEQLKKEGIEIEIVNFADYALVNSALADGDINLNAFQTYAYLNQQIKDKGYDITAIGDTYISAMCIYSKSIGDIKELKEGDKIAIPNDTVNLGRALWVLKGAGVITLKDVEGSPDIQDITSNPKNIELVQVDAAQIPSLLPDVAAGVINGNYALDFGLNPNNDAIFYDDVTLYPDNRFANFIAARTADKDNATYKRIVEAYQSETVEKIYETEFAGSYLPAWKNSASPAQDDKARVAVKVGVVGEMYRDIWKPVIEQMAQEGVDIELISFADYTLPNEALNNGDIDLNGFQHHAFLNSEIENKKYDITSIGDTIMAAMCIYSDKIGSLDELKDNDKIAIPNDAVNLGRALWVLQGAGVIKLKDVEGNPDLVDIISNPKNIEFVQVDASQIPSLLPDVAAGAINGNFATDFGLKPLKDAIFYDDVSLYPDNRFVNVIAARTADKDNAIYKRIVEVFQSEKVEKVLTDEFEGAFFKAWK